MPDKIQEVNINPGEVEVVIYHVLDIPTPRLITIRWHEGDPYASFHIEGEAAEELRLVNPDNSYLVFAQILDMLEQIIEEMQSDAN